MFLHIESRWFCVMSNSMENPFDVIGAQLFTLKHLGKLLVLTKQAYCMRIQSLEVDLIYIHHTIDKAIQVATAIKPNNSSPHQSFNA